MRDPMPEGDLVARIAEVVAKTDGSQVSRSEHGVTGTLTAIKAKWFLGGRKVTSHVACTLEPSLHEVHLKERATESTWGLPPPSFTIETSSQVGSRATISRTDGGVGGGGRLEFGRFRETIEGVVREAGWKFVHDVL